MKDILIYLPGETLSFELKLYEGKRIGKIKGNLEWLNSAPFYIGGESEIYEKCGILPYSPDAETRDKKFLMPYLVYLGGGHFLKKWGRIRRGKKLYSPARSTWFTTSSISFGEKKIDSIGASQILKIEFHEKTGLKKGEILIGEDIPLSFEFDVGAEAGEGEYRVYSNGFSCGAKIEGKDGKILRLSVPFLFFRGESFILKKGNMLSCGKILRIRRRKREKILQPMNDKKTLIFLTRKPAETRKIVSQTGWRKDYIEKMAIELDKEGELKIYSFFPTAAVSREGLKEIIKKIEDKLEPFHRARPKLFGMEKHRLREKLSLEEEVFNLALAAGISDGRLKLSGKAVSLSEFVPESEREIIELEEEIEKTIRLKIVNIEKLFRKFTNRRMMKQVIAKLISEERIYYTSGFLIHSDYIEDIKEMLRGKGTITIQQFKDMTGLSRKYAIPVLELLEELGITRRENSYRKILI